MHNEDLTQEHLASYMAKHHPLSQVIEKRDNGFLIQSGSSISLVQVKSILAHANAEMMAANRHKGNNSMSGLDDTDLSKSYYQTLRSLGIKDDVTDPSTLTQAQRMAAVEAGLSGAKLDSILAGRTRIIEEKEARQRPNPYDNNIPVSEPRRDTAEERAASEKAKLMASHGLGNQDAPKSSGPINASNF